MDRAGDRCRVSADISTELVQQSASPNAVVDVAAGDVPQVGMLGDDAQRCRCASADDDGRTPDNRTRLGEASDSMGEVVKGQPVRRVFARRRGGMWPGAHADAEVELPPQADPTPEDRRQIRQRLPPSVISQAERAAQIGRRDRVIVVAGDHECRDPHSAKLGFMKERFSTAKHEGKVLGRERGQVIPPVPATASNTPAAARGSDMSSPALSSRGKGPGSWNRDGSAARRRSRARPRIRPAGRGRPSRSQIRGRRRRSAHRARSSARSPGPADPRLGPGPEAQRAGPR